MTSITLDQSNFSSTINQDDKPILVDFWAQHCRPCEMISPLIDQVAAEVGDSATVAKVKIDGNTQALAGQFGIRSVPTLLFSKMEKLDTRSMAAMSPNPS